MLVHVKIHMKIYVVVLQETNIFIFKNMERFNKECIYINGEYCFVLDTDTLKNSDLKTWSVCCLCPFVTNGNCNCIVGTSEVLIDYKYYEKI